MRVCARSLASEVLSGHTETQGDTNTVRRRFVGVLLCVVVSRCRLFTHSPSRLLGNWGCTSGVGEEMGKCSGQSYLLPFFS